MILCIAEKPSVAKDIAEVIGAKQRNNGFYEGNGYWVTWTFGHLCTLNEPHDYKENWKYWKLEDLPIVPKKFGIKLIDNDGVKRQFAVIENDLSPDFRTIPSMRFFILCRLLRILNRWQVI